MKRLFAMIVVSIALLLNSCSESNNKQTEKLCLEESKKSHPDRVQLQKYCIKAAERYQKENSISKATFYYLLAGEYEKNLNTTPKVLDSNTAYSNIAHSYILNGNLKQAKKHYILFLKNASISWAGGKIERDYSLLNKLYPEQKNNLQQGIKIWYDIYTPFGDLYTKYKQAKKSKQYKDATGYLLQLIEMQKNNSIDTWKNSMKIWDNIYTLGILYYYDKEYKKSLHILDQIEKLDKKNIKIFYIDYVELFKWMGECYIALDDHKKAVYYFEKALKVKKTRYTKDMQTRNYGFPELFEKISSLYVKTSNYPKALEYQQKVLDFHEGVFGERHASTMKNYSNMGWLYEKLGDYPKALEYHKKALACKRQVLGKVNQDWLYEELGDKPYVREAFLEALAREKALGKEDASTAISYESLGRLYGIIGNYPKALKYHQKALSIRKDVLGKEDASTATSYNNLGVVYKKMGDYPKALDYFQKASAINEKTLGNEHTSTVISYNNLGSLYRTIREYPKALKYYQKALAIYEKTLGNEHASTVTSYNNLGLVYTKMVEYPKALEYYQKALAINKKTLGNEHSFTLTNYDNLGAIYTKMVEYPKALKYYQKALSVRKKVFGKKDASTAISYENLGLLYSTMGEYPKALEYHQKALSVRKKVFGKKDASIAESYNSLGWLYQVLGDYLKALEYYQKASVIYEKTLGNEHVATATCYDNLGSLYRTIKEYPKALEYHQKASAIHEKTFGKEAASTARSYILLGQLYHDFGDFPKALKYYQKASAIYEKTLGKEDASTATSYGSLGLIYKNMGDYTKALEYYQKASAIYEKTLGNEHDFTAIGYDNLGSLYRTIGDYPKALEYYQKALSIKEKILGEEHASTATSYSGLGNFYQTMGDYPKALVYYQKALSVREKVLGKEDSSVAISNNNFGKLYQNMGDYPKAYHYAQLSFDIFIKNRDQVFNTLDAKQKDEYLKSHSRYVSLLFDISVKYLSDLTKEKKVAQRQALLQSVTNAWINYKGSIFDSENAIAMLYASTKDKKLKHKIYEIGYLKRLLAKRYQSLPKSKERDDWQKRIKTLERKIVQLTNEISVKATSFKEQQGLKSIDYQEVTNHLEGDELYIDYAKIGSHYYLFSLDSKEHIEFIQIDKNSTKKIDTLVKVFREDVNTILNDNNLTEERLKVLTESSKAKLSKLYEFVIQKPLKDTLKDKTTLIISPDGALRLLPFEALYDKEHNKYFIEKKEIRYIPSGKELVRLYKYSKDRVFKAKKSTIIFANPNFDTKIFSASKEEISITPNTNRSAIIKSLFRMRFAPLPGTIEEAKAIKNTLKRDTISEYQENNATEFNLMNVRQPKILHIATHGFFINDNTIHNPMLKSGIALAGANASAIKGEGYGIVTALKLSGLDLEGTDLVVLSACQTGVVDINSTDSVSGLSKAFIQAGAKDIVMSLWSVDDQATKELMTSFYQEMKKNKNYAKALKAAKLKMIAEDRHPFYWGAFVVSGL